MFLLDQLKAGSVGPAQSGRAFEATEAPAAPDCCCGGLDHWLAKAPAGTEEIWRCWFCDPPKRSFLVAKRRGPIFEQERGTAEVESNLQKSEVIIAENFSVCLCGCSHLREIPTLDGVDLRCWSCNRKLSLDGIREAMEASRRKVCRPAFAFETHRRKLRERKNGLRETERGGSGKSTPDGLCLPGKPSARSPGRKQAKRKGALLWSEKECKGIDYD